MKDINSLNNESEMKFASRVEKYIKSLKQKIRKNKILIEEIMLISIKNLTKISEKIKKQRLNYRCFFIAINLLAMTPANLNK